jgi:DNA primase
MAIPASVLDEIRARVPLADVVGRKVRLQRSGRMLKGCCPFHNEKTPSFYVYPDDGQFHCFGCGAHGSVFDFVMNTEGLGFREAAERLADEAGIDLPEETPEDRQRVQRALSLKEVMAWAARWFQEQLQGLSGANARAYVSKRGMAPETIRAFALGFAPAERSYLKAAAQAAGIEEALAVEAGLLIAREEDGSVYDRFRNRLMFPIRDARGEVIAFGGRALDDATAKYINSPETPLFQKGRTLFNLDRAAPAARKAGQIIVVEGYMDVIALAQAGVETAVAPLGTALTEDQMSLLWRVAPEPLLCFDGDAAGQKAAQRAAFRALEVVDPGRSLRFALLPEGQDPDDMVRKGGPSAFEAAIAKPTPMVDMIWHAQLAGREVATPEQRAGFRKSLRDLTRAIQNPSVRSFYDAEFSARTDRLFGTARSNGAGCWRGAAAGASPALQAASRTNDPMVQFEPVLLLTVLNHPEILNTHLEMFAQLAPEAPHVARLHQRVLDLIATEPALDRARLHHILQQEGLGHLVTNVQAQTRLVIGFASDSAPFEVAERGFVAVCDAMIRLKSLDSDLAAATERFAEAMSEEGFSRQQALRAERQRLIEDLKQTAL